MVVAGWQGERNDERFQEVLRNPTLVDAATERAMRGQAEADESGEERGERFERARDKVIVSP
jgi:hypothetical protein